MSIETAQNWLQNHPQLIPALSVNLQEITRLSENPSQANEVVKVATRDPGLALALLIKVNSKRGPASGKDIVDSPMAAISLLGDQAFQSIFQKFPVAEQKLQKTHQLFLFQQLINRCLHNSVQAEKWGEEEGFNNIEALKTASVLAFSGEILCCVYDFGLYMDYVRAGSTEMEAERVFGFQFSELTDILCTKVNLPLAIIQSLPHRLHDGQTAKLLFHTRQVCLCCERGWQDQSTQDAFIEMAEWLQIPVETVAHKSSQHAIQAARETFVPEAWQPAARLPLLQDCVWGLHLKPEKAVSESPAVNKSPVKEVPEKISPKIEALQKESKQSELPQQESSVKQPPANEPPVKAASKTDEEPDPWLQALKQNQPPPAKPKQTPPQVFQSIKHMARLPATTQSELVNTCLKGMHNDLAMSRVSLLLISRDKKQLQNRMSLGVNEQSPLRHFSIEIQKSGLLKVLLGKPQAIWINAENLKKYHKHLPPSLMSALMTDNFLAMSLFIAEKPIGILYADRSTGTPSIDPTIYTQFKQLVTLTSKALTLVAKR